MVWTVKPVRIINQYVLAHMHAHMHALTHANANTKAHAHTRTTDTPSTYSRIGNATEFEILYTLKVEHLRLDGPNKVCA